MKKRIIATLLVALLISSIPSFAEAEDIYYWTEKDFEISEMSQRILKKLASYNVEALYKVESEDVAPEDVTFDTSRPFCDYSWTPEAILSFMRAKSISDKKAVLSPLTVKNYYLPLYYKGELAENILACICPAKSGDTNSESVVMDIWVDKVNRKETVLQILEQQGIVGYEIMQALNYEGLVLALAQKDGRDFAILLPETDLSDSYFSGVREKMPQLLTNPVLTPEETETLLTVHTDSLNQKKETNLSPGDAIVGSSAATSDPTGGEEPITPSVSAQPKTEEQASSATNPVPWWVIGGIAVVAAAAVIALLCTKPRKGR